MDISGKEGGWKRLILVCTGRGCKMDQLWKVSGIYRGVFIFLIRNRWFFMLYITNRIASEGDGYAFLYIDLVPCVEAARLNGCETMEFGDEDKRKTKKGYL